MQQGVVLELEGRQAIVLTTEAQFLRVRAQGGWQVGDQVRFSQAAPGFTWRPALAVAAAVALFALFAAGLFSPAPAVAAYLTLDLNPSIELGLDRHEKVVVTRALNEGAEAVLAAQRLRGRPVTEAVSALTQTAIDLGFFDQHSGGQQILIGAIPVKEGHLLFAEGLRTKATQAVVEVIAVAKVGAEPSSQVHSLLLPEETKQAADRAGVSAGKWGLAAELDRQLGVQIDETELHEDLGAVLIDKGVDLEAFWALEEQAAKEAVKAAEEQRKAEQAAAKAEAKAAERERKAAEKQAREQRKEAEKRQREDEKQQRRAAEKKQKEAEKKQKETEKKQRDAEKRAKENQKKGKNQGRGGKR